MCIHIYVLYNTHTYEYMNIHIERLETTRGCDYFFFKYFNLKLKISYVIFKIKEFKL